LNQNANPSTKIVLLAKMRARTGVPSPELFALRVWRALVEKGVHAFAQILAHIGAQDRILAFVARQVRRFAADNERFRPNLDQLSPRAAMRSKGSRRLERACSPRITGEGNTVAEAVAFDIRGSESQRFQSG
jgi:hypothetical protein